jgi:hypothetical protein
VVLQGDVKFGRQYGSKAGRAVARVGRFSTEIKTRNPGMDSEATTVRFTRSSLESPAWGRGLEPVDEGLGRQIWFLDYLSCSQCGDVEKHQSTLARAEVCKLVVGPASPTI